jgi:hypothetical protein
MTYRTHFDTHSHPLIQLLVPLVLLGSWGLVSCGDDESAATTSSAATAPETTATTTTSPPTTVAPTVAPTTQPATTVAPTTDASTTDAPTTTSVVGLEQPAVWPAADVVFTTPEAAAADFVEHLLRVPPVLGDFMAGDSRSGEIEVYSPGDGGPGSTVARSLLLMRQLGPDNGWFVLAAVQPMVAISSVEQGAIVPAAPLVIEGEGRGFEATIIVTASLAGTSDLLAGPEIAMGGSFETPLPYSATLDLSAAAPGSIVTILVRGDTGLETDPGEFSAIAIMIAD